MSLLKLGKGPCTLALTLAFSPIFPPIISFSVLELQRILADFNDRAHQVAALYGAEVHTTDTSMVLHVLSFYVTYQLPQDDEPTATSDGISPDQAISLFRDALIARCSNTSHARLSLN